jgi:multicopper oxidase
MSRNVRRLDFLSTATGAMAAIALPPLSQRAIAADMVTFSLTAAPLAFSPPGSATSFAAIAYNGTVPGPVLRVRAGQRMRVLYSNRSALPTSVHWHGVILPNGMDGVAGITQPPVARNGQFVYEFEPRPPGTRWYHDHAFHLGIIRGLFGMLIIEDPNDEPADAEFALVFHDVPDMGSLQAAIGDVSRAPMFPPIGSPEMMDMTRAMKAMRGARMGDELRYSAHCINGSSYPQTSILPVKVGQRVRLRVLNASFTETRYVRLADHRLRVTHADGNPLPQAVDVDALRIGVAERYDAWFDVTQPGVWLLQSLSSDPLAAQQACLVCTPGMERAAPSPSQESLVSLDYFTYAKAGGIAHSLDDRGITTRQHLELGGGKWASPRWTINGQTWPNTPRISVRRGDRVMVRFKNVTDMDHPMHLHGHVFQVASVNGTPLARPLSKDVSLVPANGGSLTWIFDADSPSGRWLLHCHNEIHMMDGMMTEVDYV